MTRAPCAPRPSIAVVQAGRSRASRLRGLAVCVALCCLPLGAHAAIDVDFTGFGNYATPVFGVCRTTVSSPDPGALVYLGPGGVGLESGLGSIVSALDGGETLRFAFPSQGGAGALGVSYEVASAGNQNGMGNPGDAFLEAFDGSHASLGVRAVSGNGLIDVTGLYGGVPIALFTVTAAGDSQRIERLRFEPAAASASFVTLNGFTDGSIQSSFIFFCDLTITGSSAVRLTTLGLGILDGTLPNLLDGSEFVRFDFDLPQTHVFYVNEAVGDANGNGTPADSFVEGFGADGASLGLVAEGHGGVHDVTERFGGVPLSGFRVIANLDAQNILSVSHVPEPAAGGSALAALFLALLARRASRRQGSAERAPSSEQTTA